MDDPNASAQTRRRASLSALMDGDGAAADEACRSWRDDASLRADWHAYHVIGEVLRSEDAACDAARDARFLARVRDRLASDPVVLAPTRASRRVRRRWMAPAAVAAGFVAVAGVVVATRMAASDPTAPADAMLASREAPARPTLVAAPAPQADSAAMAASAATATALVDGGTLIRNAELDRYLAAHRQYASAAPLAAPGGVVRSVATVAAPGR